MNPGTPVPARPTPGYAEEARERLVAEAPKRPGRTPFERDRARVLHSAALRRLAAKTQVVGPSTHDFVRNRLTHSLEVAQVARELGASLGCDPDVVETAALAHDLGHPPFGHNGERALHELMADHGGFEGNAQTLRILTRLEAKTHAPDGDGTPGVPGGRSVGLNLTRASLDAVVKYPWSYAEAPAPHGHDGAHAREVRKFGAYVDDAGVFAWLRAGLPDDLAPAHRCVEAQVMDLADDVAYSVHDVEDGIVSHGVDLRRAVAESADVWHVVRDWYLPDVDDHALDAALDRLRATPEWPTAAVDGSRRSRGGLKSLTSALVGRFVQAAHTATTAAYGPGPLTRHAADLVVPEGTRDEIAVLKGVAAHYVMRVSDRAPQLALERATLTGLVEHLLAGPPEALEPEFAADLAEAVDDAGRRRAVVDQVASLTDPSARAWAAAVGVAP